MNKPLAAWKKIFSDNLKVTIAASGLTDNDYRQKAGYSSQTWYCYKNGTRIPSNPSDVENLAAVGGVNPAQLYGWNVTAKLPQQLTRAEQITLKTPQLDYAAGSILYYLPGTYTADGIYIVNTNGQALVRRLALSIDGLITVSDSASSQSYSPVDIKSLPLLGRVIGSTVLI